ncbi:hypothetical protein D5086_000036 [Populus alba]|uniref:Uncharacterized protein n=1 Tax=Populus alba TaxID=43335 RepID=A0ACC4CUN5_POPAL
MNSTNFANTMGLREAVNWDVYVLNRCPTLAVKDVTPKEAWSEMKPSVDHFKVFGCIAHVHVPEERRTKLDNKSITCVLLGVSKESKVENLNWGDEDEERARENKNRGDGIDDAEQPGGNNCKEGDEEACDTGVETINSREGDERVRDSEIMQLKERSSRQLCGRQPPTWMGDYVSGEGLYEDKTNMALEVSTDPSIYEEAVKSTD